MKYEVALRDCQSLDQRLRKLVISGSAEARVLAEGARDGAAGGADATNGTGLAAGGAATALGAACTLTGASTRADTGAAGTPVVGDGGD